MNFSIKIYNNYQYRVICKQNSQAKITQQQLKTFSVKLQIYISYFIIEYTRPYYSNLFPILTSYSNLYTFLLPQGPLKKMYGTQKISSINDIFEVTINSSKLNILLKGIDKSVQQTQNNIQNLQKRFQDNKIWFSRKLSQAEDTNLLSFKSLFHQFKAQVKNQFRQKEQIYINNVLQKQQHIKELEYSIETLNDKISKNKDYFQQSIQSCIKQFTIEQFSLKRQFQKFQEKFTSLALRLDDKLQVIQSDYIEIAQKANQLNQRFTSESKKNKCQTFTCLQSEKKCFQQTINTQKYKFSKQNQQPKNQSTIQKRKIIQRKKYCKRKSISKRKVQQPVSVNYLATLQYASISQKVNQLQKKISETQQLKDISAEEVVKLSKQEMEQNYAATGFFTRKMKNNMMKTYSYSKGDILSCKQKQQEQESFFRTIDQNGNEDQVIQMLFKKTEYLEKQLLEKNKFFQTNLKQLKERQVIIDQKYQVLNKKNSKNTSELAQSKLKILHMQKKFHNDSNGTTSMSQLQNQFSKLLKKCDKELEAKTNIQTFRQEKQKVANKLKIVQQNLIQKVDKVEVKKAFNFLQDKIKQIILVLANDFNQDKVGAINRIPFKCLTCDREKLKVQNLGKQKMMSSTTRNQQKIPQQKDGTHYYNRILKSRISKKHVRNNNFTSMTQMTEGDD